jgi:hypothetical protein
MLAAQAVFVVVCSDGCRENGISLNVGLGYIDLSQRF